MDAKRFDNWEEVDCNECARWWDSSCDGARERKMPCNSFLATRSVLLPEKLKDCQNAIKWLSGMVILLTIAVAILAIGAIGGV